MSSLPVPSQPKVDFYVDHLVSYLIYLLIYLLHPLLFDVYDVRLYVYRTEIYCSAEMCWLLNKQEEM
jgi:hypothetical protein